MQVRLHLLSTSGRVTSKKIGQHEGRAHKLAVDPSQIHCFYSSGEDAVVRHYDVRQRRAGCEKLLTVFSTVTRRVRSETRVTFIGACANSLTVLHMSCAGPITPHLEADALHLYACSTESGFISVKHLWSSSAIATCLCAPWRSGHRTAFARASQAQCCCACHGRRRSGVSLGVNGRHTS